MKRFKSVFKRIAATLVTMAMTATMLPVIPISAQENDSVLDTTAQYYLVNKATGQTLERTLDTSYAPPREDIYLLVTNEKSDSNNNQKWMIAPNGGKGYRISCIEGNNVGIHKTGEAFEDIPGANNVVGVENNSAPMQTWEMERTEDGYYTFCNTYNQDASTYDKPQYLSSTSKEYLGTEGSYYIAATAENNSDNTLWKLEKVEGTGYPDLEPLEPFEPVENKVDDVQTMLEEGSVKLEGVTDKAALLTQNEELKKLDWKRLVDPFRYKQDTNPETWQNWRGEFWGKYVRGACFTYAYTQDEELYKMIEDTVRDLLTTQEPSGRISSNATDNELGTRDIWNRKYVMLGLESFLEISKEEELSNQVMEALCRHADQMLTILGPKSEGKTPVVETGDWNGLSSASILEPMVNLYRMTGYQRYLDFCTEIVDVGFTRVGINLIDLAIEGEKLPSEYMTDQTKAYELTSCFEGLVEYYRVTGIEKYRTACLNYYRLVSENELTVAGSGGGSGSGSDYSYPNPGGEEQWNHMAVNQTDSSIQHMQETCITVTWMKYCFQVLRLAGDAKIADDIELSAYNALIGSMKLYGAETADYPFLFDYFSRLNGTRLNAGGGAIFSVADGQPIGSCCSANGDSGTGLLPYMQLLTTESGVVFNLYNPGSLQAVTPSGKAVELVVDTVYPKEGTIKITVTPEQAEQFAVSLRIPTWSNETTLTVNGETITATPGEYAIINREWTAGDTIELTLDMRTRIINDLKGVGKVALQRGPITLARDVRFGENIDLPVSIATDKDGFAIVTPVDTEVPCNMAFSVATTDGGSFTVMDYASAGQTWDNNSRYATWLQTAMDTGITEGVEYGLESKNSGLMMSVTLSNNNVERGTELTDPIPDNQIWKFQKSGEYYQIVNPATGKVLAYDTSASSSNGANVLVQDNTGADNQLWNVFSTQQGYITIASKVNHCLVSEAGDSNNIHLWEDVANPMQSWKLISTETPTVDKSALENLYNSLKDTDLSQYKDGSAKDTFKAELEKAATLLGSDTATQDEINNAVTSLQAAFDALEKKPVDKHILQYVIEQAIAKKDTDEYKNVIPAVKESYDKALEEAQAVYNDPNASQEEVNQAYAEMIKQIQNLNKQAGDKTELQALYDQVKDTDLDQYLDGETKENFKTALEAAKDVLDDENALVKDVETAYNNLKSSYEALEKKPAGEVDKTILEKVIAEANRLKGTDEYNNAIPSVQQSFDKALEEAQNVYDNPSATQEEVNTAWQTLLKEIHKLGFQKGDKTALQELYNQVKDTDLSQYRDGAAKENFKTALANAETVLADEEAMQKEIDKAYNDLKAAYEALEKLADKSQLKELLDECAGYQKEEYTPATWEVFAGIQEKAQEVYDNANASQEEINAAIDELLSGMLQLRFKADKSILETVIKVAGEIDGSSYTAESYGILQAAVAKANEVMGDENASQEEVDAAATRVQEAMKGLVTVETPAENNHADGTQTGQESTTPKANAAKTGDFAPIAGLLILAMATGSVIAAKKRK